MADLRALLGDKYDETIEKAVEALYDECGRPLSCSKHGHMDEAVSALAAVLPDLLATAWDAAVASMRYEDGTPVQLVSVVNPYRPEPTTGRPEAALGPTNSPNPIPSATQPQKEPHNTEGA